jgi:3-oxoacyl-[acyl-carrier-protein] synthase-3
MIHSTGAAIPGVSKKNSAFAQHQFYDGNQTALAEPSQIVTEKFEAITGIRERRYAPDEIVASDLALEAARQAIQNGQVDPESLDFIIVATNFGDVKKGTIQTDFLPALSARVKQGLGIRNPNCTVFDLVIGCPGWIQAFIQADLMIRCGEAVCGLIIGAETLSRVLDPYDRDSMIYSDGAGAAILEGQDLSPQRGVLAHKAVTHTLDEAYYLHLGPSNFPESDERIRYIKMEGRKIYEFALQHVPVAMKAAFDQSGRDIRDLKKIFIHQANEKMDEAIIKRFFRLYGFKEVPPGIVPMNIHELGNSSVATVPTLFHQVLHGEMEDHALAEGDLVLFASVGAGMHINALVYGI